jgi:hypothetical protein
MRRAMIVGCVAACVVSGCGGEDRVGPPDPAPASVTGIAINLRDVVLVGTTAGATATATMSNSTTQSVTTGFRSDAASIAAVTDSGTVTGVANGDAAISVVSGGITGTRRIRVAPNYGGRWQGQQIVTACRATEDFRGACEEGGGVVGLPFPIGLTGRQPDTLALR